MKVTLRLSLVWLWSSALVTNHLEENKRQLSSNLIGLEFHVDEIPTVVFIVSENSVRVYVCLIDGGHLNW
jgi:hypothetical protein